MKRFFCPKCDNLITVNIEKYSDGQIVPLVCSQCGSQFKVKIGRKTVKGNDGEEREVKEPDFSLGYITVIENQFCYKQELPLTMGDNVIGRRNKDTDGVDVPIITSDPSMGRKHCVLNVSQNKAGDYKYQLRDFPSLTGTFIGSELIGKNERVLLDDEAVVTIGATTFILHVAGTYVK